MRNFFIHTLFLIIISISFLLCTSACYHRNPQRDSNILVLDSLILKSDHFVLEKLKNIAEIKQKQHLAQSDSEKYLYSKMLFDAYFTLNADSALSYSDKSLEYAKKTSNPEWITETLINKASLLAASGLLKEALDNMNQINPTMLSDRELVEYYGQMIYIYSHLGNYAGGSHNPYYVTERLYKDSIMRVIKPEHPEYLWYKSWDILGTNQNPDSVIAQLEKCLSVSSLNTRQDAKNAYVLARLYEQKRNQKKYEQNMALSAIIDVKIANAEIASLEDLAILMFNDGKGDIDRAYSYINYSLEKALEYPNRSRAFGISQLLKNINTAYQKKMQKSKRNTQVFLVLVCVLAGILIFAAGAMIIQNKKLKRQHKIADKANDELNQKIEALSVADRKLSEMNQLLKNLNTDLTKKNDELYEANFVKEEYIGYVFKLCSGYIARIEDFKRNIYIKAVKKQWKDIENSTADLDMKEELKEFYHSFDTIFLNLYPTFVSDFNSLLYPDKQIIPKEGELLNMELRIYALIRLGITDSVKIADFLHCAPQTVYNYRLKVRTRSELPKNEFIERVKSIGNFQGKE